MIMGVKHSGCKKFVWRHNDLDHLDELLAQGDPNAPKIVLFESVRLGAFLGVQDSALEPVCTEFVLEMRLNFFFMCKYDQRTRFARRHREGLSCRHDTLCILLMLRPSATHVCGSPSFEFLKINDN